MKILLALLGCILLGPGFALLILKLGGMSLSKSPTGSAEGSPKRELTLPQSHLVALPNLRKALWP